MTLEFKKRSISSIEGTYHPHNQAFCPTKANILPSRLSHYWPFRQDLMFENLKVGGIPFLNIEPLTLHTFLCPLHVSLVRQRRTCLLPRSS